MTNSPPKSQLSSPPVRMGAIAFVNTVPIYSDYTPTEGIELVYDVPARLNERVLAGELAISPVSSACYLRNQERLRLLEGLSVSSPGAVESVIFLSQKPFGPELLSFPQINIPNDSETSVALLAYLLQCETGVDASAVFRTYEAAHYRQILQETGNALIIGDNALMIQNAGVPEGYYCYDLSSLWKEKTGLPFVFAVWVADKAWAERYPDQLMDINRSLCESHQRFFSDSAIFQKGLAVAKAKSHLPEVVLIRYYRDCLSYELDEVHQSSLTLFGKLISGAENSNSLEGAYKSRFDYPDNDGKSSLTDTREVFALHE